MKRIGSLFNKAFTKDALLQAFYNAAKHKRKKRACFNFEKNLGSQIDALYDELHNNRYTPRPYYSFEVYEPKRRIIYAPAFRDCVVQHAIFNAVNAIFERSFIDQSYACRQGKGTHKAADYAQNALQKSAKDSYTLKLDIRKFFYRIDRTILNEQIKKKIKDKKLVTIMMMFTDYGDPVGIPIGNLLSQLYALIYLNPLDHFIKRELKVNLYCRYVDDFILFNLTKNQAIEYKQKIVDFINTALNLELSKSTLAKTTKGVNFVGYRTWSSKRFIRKRSLFNFRTSLKKQNIESAVSIIGHAKNTHSQRNLILFFNNTLPKEQQHG